MSSAEMYVPGNALKPADLKNRYRLLERALNQGFSVGLMLILKSSQETQGESRQIQLDNLDPYVKLPQGERPAIFVHHPNKPLEGVHGLQDGNNFFANPGQSQEWVEQTIDFAAQIPQELTPKSGQTVNIHLNTLLLPHEWHADPEYWSRHFEDVTKRIHQLSEYAKARNITLAVETVPIPEFGDMPKNPANQLTTGVYWAELGNPWPLLFWRNDITQLRQAGSSLTIDLCHSFIALKTISEIARLPQDLRQQAVQTYMLYETDLDHANSLDHFAELVLTNTLSGDIWHVSDTRDIYKTPPFFEEQKNFEEGVELFAGEIPKDQLECLIQEGLKRVIKFVIEVNEQDYTNNPHTQASLNSVLQLA
jgi:hypothetical protein